MGSREVPTFSGSADDLTMQAEVGHMKNVVTTSGNYGILSASRQFAA
jgi:hypothetical protein